MYIERILCPIVTLGPGKRLVLWTKGCSKKCPGCISPEMAQRGNAKDVPVEELFRIIENVYHTEGFDGITISGGDPLEQLPELLELLLLMRQLTEDILVYTGFVWEDFAKTLSEEIRKALEERISVLIDGPYRQEENYTGLSLRGSANQKTIFFDPTKKALYESYMAEGRKLQNVYMEDMLMTVGIMDR